MTTDALWQSANPDTPSDMLDDLKTVDGVGSGLDADLLDGAHGAAYLLVADIDDAPVDGVVNAPISSNWAYDHAVNATAHGSGVATDGYVLTADGAGGTAWEAAASSGALNILVSTFNGGF